MLAVQRELQESQLKQQQQITQLFDHQERQSKLFDPTTHDQLSIGLSKLVQLLAAFLLPYHTQLIQPIQQR